MSSIKTNIIHDHIYLSEKILNKKDNHRIIRKKCDIQTDEDREEYFRRRSLNNASCRISRLHRQSKFDFIIKKCLQYEVLNTKLTYEKSILIQVINQLKEHLRSLIPKNIK
jgi:hypothetical protein